jgi:hypothetical protein
MHFLQFGVGVAGLVEGVFEDLFGLGDFFEVLSEGVHF